MIRLRFALATALVAVLAWAVPVSAHGVAFSAPTPPQCSRSGDSVSVAIVNPDLFDGGGVFVAFYLQGYYTGNRGWAVTNNQIWHYSTASGEFNNSEYNYGNGVWANTTMISYTGTTPDYWGVWTYVQWADGHGEWAAWTGWCYA
jgi:hypothetical protein